jgi:hypothetical protein
LTIVVDDILIASSDDEKSKELIAKLNKKFKVIDTGFPEYVIGMHITHDLKGKELTLSQELYIKVLAEKYGVHETRPVSTPMDRGTVYKKDMGSQPADEAVYRSLIGALLYCILTRPDVAAAVSILARYMGAPQRAHMKGALRLLRYLYHTRFKRLLYSPINAARGSEVETYTDSAHQNCLDTARSRAGFLVLFCACLICWKSKMQSIVAQSSTEAEYIASNDAVKETIWVRRMAKELGFPQKATKVHIDSMSAKALASAQMTKTLTKHIRLRYHWVREQVAAGKVFLAYINTKKNWADAMTKIQVTQMFVAFVGRFLTGGPASADKP